MEPPTLAMMVVSFLAPYFAKAGESFAEEAGKAVWDKLKAIHAEVKNKLAGDSFDEETLKHLEAEPESKAWQSALAGVLEEKLKTDASLAKALQKLLIEANEAIADVPSGLLVVNVWGETGDITQILGKIEGNLHIGRKNE